MAVKRAVPNLNVTAPPPSPIPTAKGIRSAANEILSRYLEKSLHVPALVLPDAGTRHLSILEEIDLPALVARESESVDRMLRWARECGAFRMGCHGITKQEIKAVVRDAERIFGVLEERDTGFRQNFGGNREEIIWVRSQDQRMAWAREYIGPQLYQSFSEKMEDVASKLEAMAEELSRIFAENADMQQGTVSHRGGSILSIYRYNHDMIINNESSDDTGGEGTNYVMNLHLPAKHCQFQVQLGQNLFCFDAGPESIIVTVGRQLEERSMGEFKAVSGKIIYEQDIRARQASFSIELKWSPLKLSRSLNSFKNLSHRTCKKISLQNQLLVALIVVSISSFLLFKSA